MTEPKNELDPQQSQAAEAHPQPGESNVGEVPPAQEAGAVARSPGKGPPDEAGGANVDTPRVAASPTGGEAGLPVPVARTPEPQPGPEDGAESDARDTRDATLQRTDAYERWVLYAGGATFMVAILAMFARMLMVADSERSEFGAAFVEHAELANIFCYSSMALALDVLHASALLRMVQVVLGSALAVLGALLVVRGAQASYSLSVTGSRAAALSTSSPGLVLITLAAAIVIAATYQPMKFDYTPPAACFPIVPTAVSSSSGPAASASAEAAVAGRSPPSRTAPPSTGSGVVPPAPDAAQAPPTVLEGAPQ